MCNGEDHKPDYRIRETRVIGYYRKDNQPADERGDHFVALLRPCLCGKTTLGSVPGGQFWYEVEDVIL